MNARDVQSRTVDGPTADHGAAVGDDVTVSVEEIRDQLPEDLDAQFVGLYEFPDNSRRRTAGLLYAAAAGLSACVYVFASTSPVVNVGWLLAAILLGVVAVINFTSGWPMEVDEKQALVVAQQSTGFPVGHASAQQVWHGVRARPTWRVLCYSSEDPPSRRGLVLVDAIDGRVIEQLIQENLDEWD